MSGTDPIERLYIDTCVYIYAFEGTTPDKRRLRSLFLPRSVNGRPWICTSELTFCECLVGDFGQGGSGSESIYETLALNTEVHEVGPVNWAVLWRAARLRAQQKSLRLPDAIHAATAISFGCSHLLTGDLRMGTRLSLEETRRLRGEEEWKGPGAVEVIGVDHPALDAYL